MTTARSFRFARNIGWAMLGQAAVAATSFFVIPYLVARMGVEDYGLYILLHSVPSYLLLLTLGSSTATVKYVAEFIGKRDGTGLHDALAFSWRMHLFGGFAGSALLFLGARFFAVRVLHVPERLVDDAVSLMRCAAAAGVFLALNQYALSALLGLQRLDLQNLGAFLQNLLIPLGACAMVWLGLGLTGIGWMYVVVSLVVCATSLWFLWRALRENPHLRSGEGLSWEAYRKYSLGAAPGPLAAVFIQQFDKVLIARGASIFDLTLYAVPSGLIQRIQIVPATISAVLTPMMSEVHGPEAKETLARIYLKSVRFLLWASLPAYILLFSVMPQFLTLWLGGDFAGKSVWPARLFVIAQTFYLLTYVATSAANSRGKPFYLTILAWVQAVISIVSWRLLIPRLGILGAGAGALLAQALPCAFYLQVIHSRILGITPGEFISKGLKTPFVSAVLLLAVVFPFHALATSWTRLVLLVACGGLAYYGSTWYLLNPEDRDILKRYLRWEPASAGRV